jgi:hypothetical protein
MKKTERKKEEEQAEIDERDSCEVILGFGSLIRGGVGGLGGGGALGRNERIFGTARLR